MEKAIKNFLSQESAGGILLLAAVILAMLFANSPLAPFYQNLLDVDMQWRLGNLDLNKPILLWINDGLMAVFFLLIGLEVKRELLEGALSSPSKAALPTIAAIGGIIVPSVFYLWFNYGTEAQIGWAIPAATDIAFALGVLAALGSRIPVALKVFLLALAIIDDLGVIVIIALFYSADLSTVSLIVASLAIAGLFAVNRARIASLGPYMILGTILWIAVLKSGVHATLAGVILAFMIPLRIEGQRSPALRLEHAIHPWSTFFILPVFAFANAGVSVSGATQAIFEPVTLGIVVALFFGKPIGVMLFSFLAVKLRLAQLPEGVNWNALAGVAVLCGIGFTMSMFISSLAFTANSFDMATGLHYGTEARLGILAGSALAVILGYLWLHKVYPNDHKTVSVDGDSVKTENNNA
ncbi:Na+/H+ antiporter NhaA [Paraferrimonas sp. SM1919]|uniref:Na+/H+ antiporter NhaA n=1 Tax=Paraferrimonas sp. SM1919 TaxID=2662263 RepID=UPI0013CF4967|nr:Na+/H+ antiporter NhaA [Paraferrimonas sp. SM1919]